uniref:Putative portal protein n=1 Tax=viral metagenome TaxID=1070528 RepID=A0A6M3IEU4_9ZZZZ
MEYEGKDTQTKPGIKTFNGWVYDSYTYFADNRAEMWRDEEMYDGVQWTAEQAEVLRNYLGMYALTINRTFPTINMLLGMQALSKTDIGAKGRSKDDTDLTPIVSEGIKFVLEQNEGEFKIADAFRGAVIPGFSAIEVLKNPDPRKEKIKTAFRNWRGIWWDAYGSPWLETEDTRYVFTQRWVDMHDMVGMFPNKKGELENYYYTAAGDFSRLYPMGGGSAGAVFAEMDDREEFFRSAVWTDKKRKRLFPTQMWYTVRENALFATFSDGRCFEIEAGMPLNQQFELIQSCQEVIKAFVPKMRVAIFVGPILLVDSPTPHNHDEFPFAPFIGYLDRYKRPYGVPRQIRDMDIEVNKRRTSALAKLNARRVMMEEGAVTDVSELRREASRPDGVVILRRGFGDKVKIEDHRHDLRGQLELLQESEREIGETSGAVAEQMGTQSNAVSGVAIQNRQQKGATITAPLFQNQRRSKKRLGYLIVTSMQQHWKQEKVVRVTDTFKGVDRFIIFNEAVKGDGGSYAVKNSIDDIKFDIVVVEDTFSDLLREKYAEILIETTKRAAPEAIPLILDVAFEMLDFPRKQYVLMRLRQAFNLDVPVGDDLTKEEVAEQIKTARAKQEEVQQKIQTLDIEEKELKNEKIIAQIRKLLSQSQVSDRQAERSEVDAEVALVEQDRADDKLRIESGLKMLEMNKEEKEARREGKEGKVKG